MNIIDVNSKIAIDTIENLKFLFIPNLLPKKLISDE